MKKTKQKRRMKWEPLDLTDFLEPAHSGSIENISFCGTAPLRSASLHFIQTREKWNGAALFHHTPEPNATLEQRGKWVRRCWQKALPRDE
jgi:hypothetical protein